MLLRIRRSLLMLAILVALAPAAYAATITVPAGGDLQAALNQAMPGDTILLAPGATYTGNFTLPIKSGTGYITIRSAAADSSLPAAGQRITPAYAAYLPKIRAANGNGPAIATMNSSHHYILMFLEFLPNPSGAGALIELGSATSTQNSLSVVPHDFIVDRCYLHGNPGSAQLRGIALNSGTTAILNNYISEIKAAGADSQAIAGWNGPGPYSIVNNYLEAAGENILIGGSSMYIPNCTPTGIQILNNYVTKQVAWRNTSWVVKNLLELKHAQDVTVNGNVFEYNWQGGQPGFGIVMTPRNQYNDNPWTVVQRVSFTNNLVRHVSSGINILGYDNNSPSLQTNHLTFANNVFEDVSAANWGGSGRWIQITETPYVTATHNTVFNSASAVYPYGNPSPYFVFTNNIVNAQTYGILGDASSEGNGTIASYFSTGGSFADDLFVAVASAGAYPTGNYYPAAWSAVGFTNQSGGDYHLTSSCIYKGKATDSTDPGANIDALNAALSGAGAPPPPPPPPPPAVPSAPASPSPANAATGVAQSVALSWTASGATWCDLYAGTGTSLALVASHVSSWTYQTSGLAAGTTYTWYVVAGNSAGTVTGANWTFTTASSATPPPPPPPTAPSAPSYPTPASGATGVALNVTLGWTATGATWYDVYGGAGTTLSLIASHVASPTYAASGLSANTKYSWQIVAGNATGSTRGPAWTLTTGTGTTPPPPSLPSAPASPSPASAATGVAQSVALSWTATGATWCDLYVGTGTSLTKVASHTTRWTYQASGLAVGTTYTWYVVAGNTAGTTTGAKWTFTTSSPAPTPSKPAAPSSPAPASGTTGVSTTPTLSWACGGAQWYDVYGSAAGSTMTLVASHVTAASLKAPQLAGATKYQWQVVAGNSAGTTTGPVWTFTTK